MTHRTAMNLRCEGSDGHVLTATTGVRQEDINRRNRFLESDQIVEPDIRLRSKSAGVRPNVRNRREEAMALIEEMRRQLL